MDFIPTGIYPTIDTRLTYPIEFKLVWEVDDQPDFSKLPASKKVKYIRSYDEGQWRMLKLTIVAKYGAYSESDVRYNIPSSLSQTKLQQIVNEVAANAKAALSSELRDKITLVPVPNWSQSGPTVDWKLPKTK